MQNANAEPFKFPRNKQSCSGLYRLPSEIRIEILRFCLTNPGCGLPSRHHLQKHARRMGYQQPPDEVYRATTNLSSQLLRCCQFLHEEGRQVLYEDNVPVIYATDTNDKLFISVLDIAMELNKSSFRSEASDNLWFLEAMDCSPQRLCLTCRAEKKEQCQLKEHSIPLPRGKGQKVATRTEESEEQRSQTKAPDYPSPLSCHAPLRLFENIDLHLSFWDLKSLFILCLKVAPMLDNCTLFVVLHDSNQGGLPKSLVTQETLRNVRAFRSIRCRSINFRGQLDDNDPELEAVAKEIMSDKEMDDLFLPWSRATMLLESLPYTLQRRLKISLS